MQCENAGCDEKASCTVRFPWTTERAVCALHKSLDEQAAANNGWLISVGSLDDHEPASKRTVETKNGWLEDDKPASKRETDEQVELGHELRLAIELERTRADRVRLETELAMTMRDGVNRLIMLWSDLKTELPELARRIAEDIVAARGELGGDGEPSTRPDPASPQPPAPAHARAAEPAQHET